MDAVKKAYLQLHLAVLLYGLTAILGDLIALPATILVWWRVFITSISLLFLIRFGKNIRRIPPPLIALYMGIGVVVALHWILFFGAIKYSNASICLVCMATASFFTALLEPLLLRQKAKSYEILLGVMVVPGMMLVVNNIDWSMMTGVWMGLMSAFLAALFATLNKKWIDDANPLDITFLELGSAWLFISLFMPFYLAQNPNIPFFPTASDWMYLLVLALACTTFAYVLGLMALKHLSAFAANLTVNLEPVYGIILAWLILKENEELNAGFYLGGGMILVAVFSYPFIKKRVERAF